MYEIGRHHDRQFSASFSNTHSLSSVNLSLKENNVSQSRASLAKDIAFFNQPAFSGNIRGSSLFYSKALTGRRQSCKPSLVNF